MVMPVQDDVEQLLHQFALEEVPGTTGDEQAAITHFMGNDSRKSIVRSLLLSDAQVNPLNIKSQSFH